MKPMTAEKFKVGDRVISVAGMRGTVTGFRGRRRCGMGRQPVVTWENGERGVAFPLNIRKVGG